jgi:Rap1a immunity proteins
VVPAESTPHRGYSAPRSLSSRIKWIDRSLRCTVSKSNDGGLMAHKATKIAIAAICIGQLQTSAHAEQSTQMVKTTELISWCADGSPVGSAACTAFIMGVADSVMTPSVESCSGNATRDQIREAVVRDILKQQPGAVGLPAAIPVLVALQRAFPCQKR